MSQLALTCPLILQIKRKEKERKKNNQIKEKKKKRNNDLADLPSHDNRVYTEKDVQNNVQLRGQDLNKIPGLDT